MYLMGDRVLAVCTVCEGKTVREKLAISEGGMKARGGRMTCFRQRWN